MPLVINWIPCIYRQHCREVKGASLTQRSADKQYCHRCAMCVLHNNRERSERKRQLTPSIFHALCHLKAEDPLKPSKGAMAGLPPPGSGSGSSYQLSCSTHKGEEATYCYTGLQYIELWVWPCRSGRPSQRWTVTLRNWTFVEHRNWISWWRHGRARRENEAGICASSWESSRKYTTIMTS